VHISRAAVPFSYWGSLGHLLSFLFLLSTIQLTKAITTANRLTAFPLFSAQEKEAVFLSFYYFFSFLFSSIYPYPSIISAAIPSRETLFL
jgi:hypothetical protein